jgi:hypothetical protein
MPGHSELVFIVQVKIIQPKHPLPETGILLHYSFTKLLFKTQDPRFQNTTILTQIYPS